MNHNFFAAVVATLYALIVIAVIGIGIYYSPRRSLPREPNAHAGDENPDQIAGQSIPSVLEPLRPSCTAEREKRE